jgi:23S rRNA (cytosine1962-C5)-methyltransferase
LGFQVLADILNRPWLLKMMQDRGQDPNMKNIWRSLDFCEAWQASEGNLKYQFRESSGQSAGLFLDQADRRAEIQSLSQGKAVLNLFSYTCGFSVAAAQGGATMVTSVDASANFLNWGKDNFALNSLDSAQHEFFTQDVLFFLQTAAKRKRQFDLIICDPPSFGRFKKEVFRLEKDLPELLELCWKCLRPGSQNGILFSCNFERWSAEELMKQIRKILPKAKLELNSARLDYEIPGQETLMKSVWIRGL